MHNLAFEVLVSNADGSERHWDGARRPNLDDASLAWFTNELTQLYGKAVAFAAKFPGDLSASFSVTVDGQATVSAVSGVSKKAVAKFQREYLNVAEKLVKLGEHQHP